jgi:hypothetical protein
MTLKKIDHQFAFDQLSYDVKPNYQPYIKLTFFFSKLPNVSYEQVGIEQELENTLR